MSDGIETLSIEEVARLLSRLRQADHLRLAALAQAWISGCPRLEAAELLNEALARVLSGARPWPADVTLPAFLSQVMRSIASQWRHENQREPLLEDADVIRDENVITLNHDFTDLRERMRKALDDDPDARDRRAEFPPPHPAITHDEDQPIAIRVAARLGQSLHLQRRELAHLASDPASWPTIWPTMERGSGWIATYVSGRKNR